MKPTTDVSQSVRGPGIVAVKLHVPKLECACDPARQNAGKAFAVGNAPNLPLRECTRADCTCSYERIAERRKGERRTSPDRRDAIRFETKRDRRTGRDRRKLNTAWNSSSTV